MKSIACRQVHNTGGSIPASTKYNVFNRWVTGPEPLSGAQKSLFIAVGFNQRIKSWQKQGL
ncbi:MAG: hypothetical protein ACXVJD_18140 [Mucilaginibacter sp.]